MALLLPLQPLLPTQPPRRVLVPAEELGVVAAVPLVLRVLVGCRALPNLLLPMTSSAERSKIGMLNLNCFNFRCCGPGFRFCNRSSCPGRQSVHRLPAVWQRLLGPVPRQDGRERGGGPG